MNNYKVRAVKENLYIDGSKWEADYLLDFDEADNDEKADLFSVYQVNEDGTDDWVADFYRREDAELFARVKAEQ
jgi:hypothetical protein